MGQNRKFGKAVLELSLNDKVTKGLRSVQDDISKIGSQISSIGKGFAAVGASIVGPLIGAVSTFASVGDELNKMAARTGLSVKALGELKFAAAQSGTSLEAVEKGIRGMAKVLLTAEQGSKGAIDKLAELGFTVEDLAGKSPEKQFEMLAAAVASIEDPTRRSAASMAVFGKAGSDMLPLFADGVAGMDALRQEAHDLGIVLGEEDATAAAALTDAISRLQEQFKAIIVSIGSAVAGPLTEFAGKIGDTLSEMISWIKLNSDLVVTIAKIGVALSTVGAVIISFGGAFQIAAVAVGGLTTAFTLMLAHPVVAAIGAITVAAFALWNEYDRATNSVKNLDKALNRIDNKRTDGDPEELALLAKRFEQLAGPRPNSRQQSKKRLGKSFTLFESSTAISRRW